MYKSTSGSLGGGGGGGGTELRVGGEGTDLGVDPLVGSTAAGGADLPGTGCATGFGPGALAF